MVDDGQSQFSACQYDDSHSAGATFDRMTQTC
jgi:hypothetical protein